MKSRQITQSTDLKQLDKQLIEQRAELRKLVGKGSGKATGRGGLTPKENGLIKKHKRTIARILTRKNQLDKGSCPKGGLHLPFQTRDNQRKCRKCRQHVKKGVMIG